MAFNAFGLDRLPFYYWYEMQHAARGPYRAAADATRLFFQNPVNPFAHTTFGKSVAASCEMFERVTRRYGKPEWSVDPVKVDGQAVAVHPQIVWQRPFCNLLHFERALPDGYRPHPKVLGGGPMAGHYPTRPRGTGEALLPPHEL